MRTASLILGSLMSGIGLVLLLGVVIAAQDLGPLELLILLAPVAVGALLIVVAARR